MSFGGDPPLEAQQRYTVWLEPHGADNTRLNVGQRLARIALRRHPNAQGDCAMSGILR